MPVLGVGVDLVHLPRIASLLSRRGPARLASRILSQEEFAEWQSLHNNSVVQFLAVRWGAKEAAYKALYPTVSPKWKELTYQGLGAGRKPSLKYHPLQADKLEQVGPMHISISHDGDYVLAMVLVESPT